MKIIPSFLNEIEKISNDIMKQYHEAMRRAGEDPNPPSFGDRVQSDYKKALERAGMNSTPPSFSDQIKKIYSDSQKKVEGTSPPVKK